MKELNYDGSVVNPGEVLIPFEYTSLDAENCKNPDAIKILKLGGKNFKVIYKAVPENWAKIGVSALTLIENEELGHYFCTGQVSMDDVMDEYELSFGKSESAEECAIAYEEIEERIRLFVSLMKKLIEKSAKIGYAVLLVYTGVKGELFYEKMKLTHNPANVVRKQAENILKDGIVNFDIESIKGYRNKFEGVYRAEAYNLLDRIEMDMRQCIL